MGKDFNMAREQLAQSEDFGYQEQEKSPERYRMVMIGGRIKTAGVSLQSLYDLAQPSIDDPESADAAFATSTNFLRFKERPPFPFLAAFFPMDTGAMKAAFKGSGIYRPTIKTDQGPAGNVGHFIIDAHQYSQLQGNIVKEEGVAVLEQFLAERFLRANVSAADQVQVTQAITEVQEQYRIGNHNQVFAGLTRLREIGNQYGVETTRRAGVGRGEFFFFRPVQTEQQVVIGGDLTERISTKTQEVMGRMERLGQATKKYLQEGLSLSQAMEKAYETADSFSVTSTNNVLYFQPDVLIRADGSFDIERINMPDLGMFLTEIQTASTNETLGVIQDTNRRIKDEVLDVVCNEMGEEIIMVTRGEVLANAEDTLEHLELRAFAKGVRERGKQTQVVSIEDINTIPSGASLALFNVASQGEAYEKLLDRVANGEIRCYPDPFVKLYEKEGTTFRRDNLSGNKLASFLQIIAPTAMDKPEGVHAKAKLIRKALERAEIVEDIIYFGIPGTDGYIPTFRYDPKSFSEVHKAVEAAKKEKPIDNLVVMPYPFRPEDAIMHDNDGPRLAVCRFMFVRQ